MKVELEGRLRELTAYEKQRQGPPAGFPGFPEIPGGRYTERGFFELERESVFGKAWLCVAREEEIAEPGCYKAFDRLGVPMLILRDKGGQIRAFYNTCRHRGARIVAADEGKTNLLRCQYHSWAYALDGRLLTVPEERDFVGLDKSCRGLFSIRCETWGGWIFVNLDDGAGPLRDYLGRFGDELDGLGMEKLRIVHRYNAVVECNWKAAMDAFQEVYHVTTIHGASLGRALDFRAASFGLFEGGHSRLVVPYHPDARATLGMTGSDVPEIPGYPEFARTASFAYSAFPNISAPLRSTVIHFQMFWPLAVDRCEMEVIGIGPDWGDGEPPAYWQGANAKFREILQEDLENLSSIQASLRTKAFTGVMANYQERRIYWHHESVDRAIGHSRVPADLAVEPLLEPYLEPAL